jgi:hypothetical protein
MAHPLLLGLEANLHSEHILVKQNYMLFFAIFLQFTTNLVLIEKFLATTLCGIIAKPIHRFMEQ